MVLPFAYNWRNLLVRKVSTALTLIIVAILVLVLAVLLSFAAGIRTSLAASGSPFNLMVLHPAATSESTSIIVPEEIGRIVQAPGIARDAAGQLLISQEISVQTSVPRRGRKIAIANVAVRGVDPIALEVHRDVKIVEGRMCAPGALEVIVGKAARDRYANIGLGGTLELGRLGNRRFAIVGVFTAAGGALESEIWGPRTVISDAYLRPHVSSAVVRLEATTAVPAAIEYINGPQVHLKARVEPDYYQELTVQARAIVALTSILIGIMAFGAIFAVANTMYGAVDGRRREVAMLRTIGFPRRSIILTFLIESLLVTVTACVVGLAASQLFNGSPQDYLSENTWTVFAYELRVTPGILATAFALATVVGITGALAPALRAARTPILEALRKA